MIVDHWYVWCCWYLLYGCHCSCGRCCCVGCCGVWNVIDMFVVVALVAWVKDIVVS